MKNKRIFKDADIKNCEKILHTPDIVDKLQQITVGIAGLGEFGSNAAVALARAGVGKLILIDFNRVELSNLSRQAYFLEHVGLNKTEAICDIIHRINPNINVVLKCVTITKKNCLNLINGASIVIEAVDKAEIKTMIIETILSKSENISVIAGSGMAGYGRNNTLSESGIERMRIISSGETELLPGVPLMAPRVGIASYMQENAVLDTFLSKWKYLG